jgi:hypothetical protein
MNDVDEDDRSRPQGRIVEQVNEDKCHKWHHLLSSTHVRCIDVSRALVQPSRGRRNIRTGNLATRQRPEGGVFSSSWPRLQTGEPNQGGEERMNGSISQGGGGAFI